MRLTDLNPRWIGTGGEGVTDLAGNPVRFREKVAIMFDCPCGGVCGGRLRLSISNPPDGLGPLEGTSWELTGGYSFETLTLEPSLQRVGGCAWHGFITDGEVATERPDGWQPPG